MITKAIIVNKETDYLYKVRIPIINRIEGSYNATADDDLFIATVVTLPGLHPIYEKGDIVYVSFEEEIISKPVIIGILYRENLGNSYSDFYSNSLEVSGHTILSKNTTIGNVSPDIISAFSSKNGTVFDNISTNVDQITDINTILKEDVLPYMPKTYRWKVWTIALEELHIEGKDFNIGDEADTGFISTTYFNTGYQYPIYKTMTYMSDNTIQLFDEIGEITSQDWIRYTDPMNKFFGSLSDVNDGDMVYINKPYNQQNDSDGRKFFKCVYRQSQDKQNYYFSKVDVYYAFLREDKGTFTGEYVKSTDPDAYPDDGKQGNYWYTKVTE